MTYTVYILVLLQTGDGIPELSPVSGRLLGDASRMGLPAQGDACCELADEAGDPRVLRLRKCDDLLAARVKEDGGDVDERMTR